MPFVRKSRSDSVSNSGAAAGCVLLGAGMHNRGLRIKVLEEQARGNDGPIQGRFVILDAGDNKHSVALQGLASQVTDAGQVLRALRRLHPGCVSVVNTNILAAESC